LVHLLCSRGVQIRPSWPISPFVLFVSFDFLQYSTSDGSGIAGVLTLIIGSSAQLEVGVKNVVPSFEGEGTNWSNVATAAAVELYAVPYYTPSADNADDDGVSGLFSWDVCPGQDSSAEVYENTMTGMDETSRLECLIWRRGVVLALVIRTDSCWCQSGLSIV
jgi:hypothetical protein